MKTNHRILFQNACELNDIPSESVDLVVTSPPYPMIKMWDKIYWKQNPKIYTSLKHGEGIKAYQLMHKILNCVWDEIYRVLKYGRFACINIGDATRKVNNNFMLYPNHAKILNYLLDIGFSPLPNILWRKQTNAPNKFLGSGMLPAGAYVTLEHEYILIVRKGAKREFNSEEEKSNRRESALFSEERNIWYSDIWLDIKGAEQKLPSSLPRERSAAYPFEIPYRLINMYSVKGDVVLDPFLGTGTTIAAAMASGRNSIGVEIDENFHQYISHELQNIVTDSNDYMDDRVLRHYEFVEERTKNSKPLKYINKFYECPVMARQEQFIILNKLENIEITDNNIFEVQYSTNISNTAFYRMVS